MGDSNLYGWYLRGKPRSNQHHHQIITSSPKLSLIKRVARISTRAQIMKHDWTCPSPSPSSRFDRLLLRLPAIVDRRCCCSTHRCLLFHFDGWWGLMSFHWQDLPPRSCCRHWARDPVLPSSLLVMVVIRRSFHRRRSNINLTMPGEEPPGPVSLPPH